ncbi:5-oxoprolinase subunit PxpA [Vibrio maerlii]|uniref:5-oxoprolinase subunit PxpA n=1 Tax=Vibrio maerlii TaxID=2231648 RepID=UPI000E3BC632|nr:5-oxoprolinase subunit PxpA [Vibrio maerlii]
MSAEQSAKKPTLLLNCDLGESYGSWKMGEDEEVMPWIDLANIACGFHASDPSIMHSTIRLAIEHKVKIGAHPSYHDLQGFGRRSIPHSSEEITQLVIYQVGALKALCDFEGVQLEYIKPHGALYNDMMRDTSVFHAICLAASSFNLPLMVLAKPDNQNYLDIADQYDVPLLFEAFADRSYTDSGSLAPRSHPNAVLKNSDDIVNQVMELAKFGVVHTLSGNRINLDADTLCVHGDNPESIALIQRIRRALTQG